MCQRGRRRPRCSRGAAHLHLPSPCRIGLPDAAQVGTEQRKDGEASVDEKRDFGAKFVQFLLSNLGKGTLASWVQPDALETSVRIFNLWLCGARPQPKDIVRCCCRVEDSFGDLLKILGACAGCLHKWERCAMNTLAGS